MQTITTETKASFFVAFNATEEQITAVFRRGVEQGVANALAATSRPKLTEEEKKDAKINRRAARRAKKQLEKDAARKALAAAAKADAAPKKPASPSVETLVKTDPGVQAAKQVVKEVVKDAEEKATALHKQATTVHKAAQKAEAQKAASLEIVINYSAVDGAHKRFTYKTLESAQKQAHKLVGETPEISWNYGYAVSADGVSKVTCKGVSIYDLFPKCERHSKSNN